MSQSLVRQVLREPFVHFLILGGLVFAVLSGPESAGPEAAGDRIVISAAEVEQMAAAWTQRAQRPPSASELDTIIAEAVREQVLYREAVALGLDRDDVVIRRHLRQKFEFITQDLAYDTDPDETTLRAFHAEYADRYARSPRLSFHHILFSHDRRGAGAQADATEALADLQSATGPQAADLLGDATSLPQMVEGADQSAVDAVFGPDFAAAVQQMEPGQWAGPVTSGYGLHLVWLSEKLPGTPLAFEKVAQRVKDDWVYDQRTKADEAVYRKLLERYEVVVEATGSAAPSASGGS